MGKISNPVASALALAWILSGHPALAANVHGKVEPVPGNLGGMNAVNPAGQVNITPGMNLIGSLQMPQGLSQGLITQLAAVQAHPIEALERLKVSQALPDVALYKVLAHPEVIARQGEALAAAIGPENFQAVATTARELNSLAEQNGTVRELLSSGGNPSAALEDFKRQFDGAALQASVVKEDDAVAVPNNFSEGVIHNSGLHKPVASSRSDSAQREILSLGEKIARGITRDEGLKLVPWEPLYEGDRPTWRLVKEGENLRVQYVPEDLQHGNKDVAIAHLMQEVFRAVYSRPDLIEPDLQSNGLFQTLYDTMETGRVVKKGLKERPGLDKNFEAFNQEQYPDGEAAAQNLKNLPNYLRLLEGALYESRLGREDSRIKDPRVLDVLKKTRSLRKKIAAASPEEAYKLSREMWPTLQKLHEESEDAAMSQKMFEKMGQEGKLGSDKEQNAAAGQGRLKLDDLNQQQREQAQKQIEKMLKEMTPEQREELRKQIQEQMQKQEQAFRKTMGKSQEKPNPGGQGAKGLAQQLEQAASRLAQEAAEAKGQAQNLEEKASQMRAQTGAQDISSKEAEELDSQAGQLHQQADRLNQSAQEFRQMAEQLKRGASSSAADKTQEQARQLGEMGRELQNQSEQLQKQTEALKKQLGQGQEQQTSSLRQKTAGIEQTAKDISEKAGKIQEAAQEAQALAQALGEQLKGGQKGSKGEGKPGQGSPKPGEGQTGQDDPLAQLLKAWSQQKSGNPGQAGESGDSQGKAEESGGEINPSGTQGTSDSVGDAQDKIEKIKSGGLDVGQRSWLDEYMEPVRGMVDTLAYKIRKHLKATALGRDLTGLYEGDVDEDALPYYKAKIGIMKEELLPGRPKSRITFLLDLSGSMGLIQGGGSLDHAARALLMALKAFKQAFKNEPGVEVRVVAYNENPQRSIIGNYMQVKDISDAVLYKVIERINEIQNTDRGDNSAERMMTQAVEDIRKDMKGHSDTTYALLHIGDGDPGADIAPKIRAIYDDPTNAKIRFANLAAGPQAQDMYDKYQPYSFWARELSELGMRWAEIVETTFKKAWRGSR